MFQKKKKRNLKNKKHDESADLKKTIENLKKIIQDKDEIIKKKEIKK